jgi:hypothetical protein
VKEDRKCKRHGLTVHTRKSDGYWRCNQCAVEVTDRARKKRKRTLVEEAGGKCEICGYSRSHRALSFHHIDPKEKAFTISNKGRTYSWDRLRAEVAKCILLCANCHMELEDDMTVLSDLGKEQFIQFVQRQDLVV